MATRPGLLLAALTAAVGVVQAPALHAAQAPVQFEQVVGGLGGPLLEPAIRRDGVAFAFRSTGDPLGANPGGSVQLFTWDPADGLQQRTQTAAPALHRQPYLDPGGTALLFVSDFDFVGANPDLGEELFELELGSGQVAQLTDHPAGARLVDAAYSGDGSTVAYTSDANPLGANPDGSVEVFRLDLETGALTQLTDGLGAGTLRPAVPLDGTRIAFSSSGDPDGTNPNGNLEIQLWDAPSGTITAVTQNPGDLRSDYPALDDAGTRVAFVSEFDFTASGATGVKVFVADTATGGLQLATPEGTPGPSTDVALSPDGRFALFESDRDLLGLNPDASRELYVFEPESGQLRQLTDVPTPGPPLPQPQQVRFADVAVDGTFAYRSAASLDLLAPPAPGFEPRLYRGRPGCSVKPYGTGGGPSGFAGGTQVSLELDSPFGRTGKLKVAGTDLLAAGLFLVSTGLDSSAAGLFLPPVLIDLNQLVPTSLTFFADGVGSAQITVDLSAATAPALIYVQAASVISSLLPNIQFESSNGLSIQLCP